MVVKMLDAVQNIMDKEGKLCIAPVSIFASKTTDDKYSTNACCCFADQVLAIFTQQPSPVHDGTNTDDDTLAKALSLSLLRLM